MRIIFALIVYTHLLMGENYSSINVSEVGNLVDIFNNSGINSHVCVDDCGNSYAVWLDITARQVLLSKKPVFGEWSAPVVVSEQDETAGVPSIFVSKNGNGVLAWAGRYIKARLIRNGQIDDDIATISSRGAISNIDCAANEAGQAIVVWKNNAMGGIVGAIYDGSWGPQEMVSPVGPVKNSYGHPRVGIDAHGNGLVIYKNGIDAKKQQVDASRYISGRGWSPIGEHLCPDYVGVVNGVSLAVNDKGEAIAGWRQQTGHFDYHLITSVFSGGILEGSWTGPQQIALRSAIYGSLNPYVAINNAGYAVIVWDRSMSQKGIYATYKLPGETLLSLVNEPILITSNGKMPTVNVDENGNALVSWFDMDLNAVYISKKIGMKGAWSPPIRISDENQPKITWPQNGVNSQGYATVIWSNQINAEKEDVIQSHSCDFSIRK